MIFFKLRVKPFILLFRYFKAKFACFTSNEIFGMFTGLSRSVRTDAVIENDRNLARSLINVNLFPQILSDLSSSEFLYYCVVVIQGKSLINW